MSELTRRGFLRNVSAYTALFSGSRLMFAVQAAALSPPALSTYEPWKQGMLDIHHIATGRGNSTLFICPDGTSMMVDAGATNAPLSYTIAPKPDVSRRPGEWIGRYARRHLQAANRKEIDYFILTHLHGDHMGEPSLQNPLSKSGNYRLCGVSDVAEILPIRRFIDRNYPSYNYPVPLNDPYQANYIAFIREQAKNGADVEPIHVGSDKQIRLLQEATRFPDFSVRNLAANGEVWTGVADETRHHFPELNSLKKDQYPDENMCSLALRLSYGKFDYFTGGDMTCTDNYGEDPWRDIETKVAQAAGPVEVAIADHHGQRDANGPGYVRALRPQVFIIIAWTRHIPP
jgi:beta-lactamase superfamily II metal-dependent hydrolase